MRVPKNKIDLVPWAREIINQCNASRAQRLSYYQYWRQLFYEGSIDETQCYLNKVYSHIDRLAGFLFSPPEVRFLIEFDITSAKNYLSRAAAGGRFLNREFHRRGVDLMFAQALETALVKDSGFLKVTWSDDGFEPWLIQPEFIGVYREDVPGLDRQEAFVHTTFMTPSSFEALVFQREDYKEIMAKVKAMSVMRSEDPSQDDYFRQIVVGGNQPVTTSSSSNAPRGSVSVFGPPSAMLAPEVKEDLICVNELWVQDDERQDYTTIRMVNADIIIHGDLKHENLSGVKEEHPFIQICANETPGYFWGRSEIASVVNLQKLLNDRVKDVNTLIGLQADNPLAFIGATDITSEKIRAMKARSGFITESNPAAKIERLAPDLPSGLNDQINQIMTWFDEMGGFSPIMTGQGESGVRAGQHAQTLLRTSSPRLKDRALLVERQCADVGDFCFKLLQAKEGRAFTSEDGEEFTLKQLPDDYRVTVDSHSGSPAFSEDSKNLAFMLAKAGAIDGESLIQLTKPPMEDTLIARVREKAAAEAKFAKEHPELAAKQKTRKK